MPVVIDGNNLLYAAQDADPERPAGREKLCRLLAGWARRTGEAVSVIFDGPAPAKALAEQILADPIDVRFSGAGVSADSVVIRFIGESTAPRQLIVVSTDREIARAARRRGARSIDSAAFWTLVVAGGPPSPPRANWPRGKKHGLEPGEVDRWLEELGFTAKPNDSAEGGKA